MDLFHRNSPETGNTLEWHAFADTAEGYYEGFVKTPACFVQVYSMQSATPFGWLCANLNGRYYQHSFEDAPTRVALIRRAHRMMKQVLSTIPEETY